MMRSYVLVGSSSAYRRSRYVHELERQGFDTCVVAGGVDCIQDLRKRTPDVLLLECSLLWGGAAGVLEIRASDPVLKKIPVVILSSDGVSTEAYHLAKFPVYGFFGRFPSGYELVSAIRSALRSADVSIDEAHAGLPGTLMRL